VYRFPIILKQKSKLIEIPDLFIGATAKAHSLKLATLNERHFSRIEGLELISINQI
jgi:tRNA(fMet)-specific endonuclease VapC